jgi:hypothetical protein
MPVPISPFTLSPADHSMLADIHAELMEWRALARTPTELASLGAVLRGLGAFARGDESPVSCDIWIDLEDWRREGAWTGANLNGSDLVLSIGEVAETPNGAFEAGTTRLICLTGAGGFDDTDVRAWVTLSAMAREEARGLDAVLPWEAPPPIHQRVHDTPDGAAPDWMLNRDDAEMLGALRDEIWSWRENAEDGPGLMAIADVAGRLDRIAAREAIDGAGRAVLRVHMSHDSGVTYGVDVEEDEVELWCAVSVQASDHTHVRAALGPDGGFDGALVLDWLRDVAGVRASLSPVAEGDLFQPEG